MNQNLYVACKMQLQLWLVFSSWTDEEKITLCFAILVSFQCVTEEKIVLKYRKVAAYLHETNLKIWCLFLKVISIVDSAVPVD